MKRKKIRKQRPVIYERDVVRVKSGFNFGSGTLEEIKNAMDKRVKELMEKYKTPVSKNVCAGCPHKPGCPYFDLPLTILRTACRVIDSIDAMNKVVDKGYVFIDHRIDKFSRPTGFEFSN